MQKWQELKPFVSVVIIVLTLFTLVFFKMEGRRSGYLLLKELRHYKDLQDQYRLKQMQYARLTSPRKLRHLAQKKLKYSEAQIGQIIQISGAQIAIKQ